MLRKFSFHFDNLSFEDQKKLYKHFDFECEDYEEFESASTLEEIQECFDEFANTSVERFSYLGALLAHGLIKVVKLSEERNTEKIDYVGLVFDEEAYFDLDFCHYEIPYHDGNEILQVVEIIESTNLDQLGDLFRKYPMIKES